MNKAVIFDIDGTLLDTTSGIRSSVNYVTDKHGFKQLTDDEFKAFLSFSPITASFSNVCKTDTEMSKICGDEFTSVYKEKFLPLAQIYDGMTDLLNYLKENQYKLGIATFKNEQNAKLMISSLNLDKYFDIICGSNGESKRTKKDILQECIKQMHSDINECFFIGDSKTDAIASSELSIPFIGVTYGFGFHSFEDINKYPNVLCANTAYEILKFLKTK